MLCVAVVCVFIADSAITNWGAVYLRDVLDGSARVAALVYGTYAGAIVLGRVLGDPAVDRFGPVPVVRGYAITAVAGLGVIVAAPTPAIGLAGFALLGLGLSIVAPQAFATVARIDHVNRDIRVARLNICSYLGFIIGTPLIGLVAHASTLRWGFMVPLLLVGSLVGMARAFGPSLRQHCV